MFASHNGHGEIVNILLQYKAIVNSQNKVSIFYK